MNNKTKSAIKWNQTGDTAYYSFGSLFLKACKNCIAISLLIIASLIMISDIFPEMIIEKKYLKYIFGSIFGFGIIYDIIILSIAKRIDKFVKLFYRVIVILVSLGIEVLCGRKFYILYAEKIKNGFLGVESVYLQLYNWYYGENINILGDVNQECITLFLVFFFIICISACYCISYGFGSKRIFALIPLGVLSAEMLVGKTPGWSGSILFIVGAYLVFSTGIIERNIGIYSNKNKKQKVWCIDLYQTIIVLSIVFGIAFLMRYIDEKTFETLMENKETVKEVQNNLENEVYESFLDVSYDSQRISNKAPSYDDDEIFLVTCDKKPTSNVYLKDYIGTNFTNGRWITDLYTFETSVSNTDIELSNMQILLLESYLDTFTKANFNIEFLTRRHNSLTPYYFETDNEEIIEIIKDALINKQASKNSFKYVGNIKSSLSKNEITEYSNEKNNDSVNLRYGWYKRFVEENYINISRKVPTARKLVSSIKTYKRGNTTYDLNMYIYETSLQVKNILSGYEYNLHLDALDKDTNPIEYFLSTSKKGYCIHFATAATLMLRELGIPARYVSGYVIKQDNFMPDNNGTFTATALDSSAHAWVEVFYPNIGWIPLEVTPGYYDNDYYYSELAEVQESNQLPIQIEADNTSEYTDEPDNKDTTQMDREDITEDKSETVQNIEHPSAEPTTQEEVSLENEVTDDIEEIQEDYSQSESETVSSNDNTKNIHKVYVWKYVKYIIIVLVCAATVLLLCLYIKRHNENEKKAFERCMQNHQYRKVVRKINRKIYKRMKRRGKFILQSPSDEEYKKILEECFDNISNEQWNQYMDIVKQAAYSEGNIEEEKAKFCINLYHNIT